MKPTKEIVSALALGACLSAAFADPFGAPPDAKHAWAVHDDYRTPVKKITAQPGKAPSDALVLFDGSAESLAANWCDAKGAPTKWVVDDNGDLISVRGAGYIFSKAKFSDVQLHVEWASPKEVQGFGQGRGNSGVFLMGNYEVQVLDSYETDADAPGGNKNPNYSDGQAGAIYGQNPPLVNPCRAPGEFNSYDIIFHAPIFGKAGEVVRPATVTVLFNGVVVQDHWLYDGPTGFGARATYARTRADTGLERADKMPIAFQDHGNPVHYRNVWVRELPRPEDNTTHGNYYAKTEDVMAERAKTAAKLDALFDANWSKAPIARQYFEALRVVAYAANEARLERLAKYEKAYLAKLAPMTTKKEADALGVSCHVVNTYIQRCIGTGAIPAKNAVADKLATLK